MRSSLQTPKLLPKFRSKESQTPTVVSLPSHSKPSDLSSSATPRQQKIRPKSLDTDFLAASEHTLSDLPDPVKISDESGSNLSIRSKSSDLSLSDSIMDQKVVSNSEFLAESEHISSDLPHPATSSDNSSTTSVCSDQKQHSLESKALTENLNKGKYEDVISASDLIEKALAEINGSKDITDDTKKIMDAMFEAAAKQLEGKTGAKLERSVAPVLIAKARIAAVLILLFFQGMLLLFKVWSVDGQDWPDGLTPT